MKSRAQFVHAANSQGDSVMGTFTNPKPNPMYSLSTLPTQAQVFCNEPLMIHFASHQTLQAGLLVLGIFFLLGAVMLRIRYYYRSKLSAAKGEDSDPGNRINYISTYYAGGYSEAGKNICSCLLSADDSSLQIILNPETKHPDSIVRIPKDEILKIKVQDAFTVRNISAPEVWQDSVKYLAESGYRKKDVAFLVIEWLHEKKNQSAYFFIYGEFPMQQAVVKCNELLDVCRNARLDQAGLSLQTT